MDRGTKRAHDDGRDTEPTHDLPPDEPVEPAQKRAAHDTTPEADWGELDLQSDDEEDRRRVDSAIQARYGDDAPEGSDLNAANAASGSRGRIAEGNTTPLHDNNLPQMPHESAEVEDGEEEMPTKGAVDTIYDQLEYHPTPKIPMVGIEKIIPTGEGTYDPGPVDAQSVLDVREILADVFRWMVPGTPYEYTVGDTPSPSELLTHIVTTNLNPNRVELIAIMLLRLNEMYLSDMCSSLNLDTHIPVSDLIRVAHKNPTALFDWAEATGLIDVAPLQGSLRVNWAVRRKDHAIDVYMKSGDVGLATLYGTLHGNTYLRAVTNDDDVDVTYAFFENTLLWKKCSDRNMISFIKQALFPMVAYQLAEAQRDYMDCMPASHAELDDMAPPQTPRMGDDCSNVGSTTSARPRALTPKQTAARERLRLMQSVKVRTTTTAGRIGIAKSVIVLDDHPNLTELLNCDPARHDELPLQNGYKISLRTGKVSKRTYGDLWSKETPWKYRPSTRDELAYVDAHMLRLMNGDEEKKHCLQELLGSCMTGLTEKMLTIWVGPTDTAKSRTAILLDLVLGFFSKPARSSVWMKDPRGGPTDGCTPGLIALRYARVGIKNETAQEETFDAERLKSLTGGEQVVARMLRKEQIRFTMMSTLIAIMNDPIKMDITNIPVCNRITVYGFDHVFSRDEATRAYFVDLETTRICDVANWMLIGAMRYLKRTTLPTPTATMQAEKAAFLTANDPVSDFVHDHIVQTPGGRVAALAVWMGFKHYTDGNPSINRKNFILRVCAICTCAIIKDATKVAFFKDIEMRVVDN